MYRAGSLTNENEIQKGSYLQKTVFHMADSYKSMSLKDNFLFCVNKNIL